MKAKRWMVVLLAVCMALFMAAGAVAQDDEDAFGNIMNTGYVAIDSVSFTAPAAGAPCKVSAKITLVDAEDYDNMAVKSAKLTYAVNGDRKAAKTLDMTGSDDTWSVEIPGQPAGAKVEFFITVVDSLGNTSTEALPVAKKDAPLPDLVAGVADIDNSGDIVSDPVDILGTSVGYDSDSIYASFDVQGDISGGTVDPPYIQIYAVKLSNPDVDPREGLMVGKMWIWLPLASDKAGRDQFMTSLPGQVKGAIEAAPKELAARMLETGMFVLNISKLLSGDWNGGFIFTAEPTPIASGSPKVFLGSIKRAAFGKNDSGFLRMVVFTAANAATDQFMPIPINCSHFIQIYTRAHEYAVK